MLDFSASQLASLAALTAFTGAIAGLLHVLHFYVLTIVAGLTGRDFERTGFNKYRLHGKGGSAPKPLEPRVPEPPPSVAPPLFALLRDQG